MKETAHPGARPDQPRRPDPAAPSRGDVLPDRQVSLGGDTHPAVTPAGDADILGCRAERQPLGDLGVIEVDVDRRRRNNVLGTYN